MNAGTGSARVLPDAGTEGRGLQPAIAVVLGTSAQGTLRALWESEREVREVLTVQGRLAGATPDIPEFRIADTIWTDRGIFPSGDHFVMWCLCEL